MSVVGRIDKFQSTVGGEVHSGWLPAGAAVPLPTPTHEVVLSFVIEFNASGYLLVVTSTDGSVDADTWHASVADAQGQAEAWYGVPRSMWRMSASHGIRERLAGGGQFSLAEVRGWMKEEGDLELWCAVYEVLGPGWKLIRPEPDMDETCAFMTRYLLRCIHEDVQNVEGDVPTGYEAARDLAACLKHWGSRLPETEPVLVEAAQRVTEAYLAAGEAERDRLLNGMLEHALEARAVRPYFQRWEGDRVLGEAWKLAMEWAVACGDPTDQ